MYYVYIIYSKSLNKRYIGSTGDLKVRIEKHNYKGSDFTSKGVLWILVYYEAFLDKKTALIEERFLKTGKGRERIKYLLGGVA